MDTQAFLAELPDVWDGDPRTADHPRDRRFEHVIEATRGMATENKLALLNLAAQHLRNDEVYLEIGAWTGCSIIGASLDNSGTFITIDNFSEFGGPIDECRRNLAEFGADNVELINADAWTVLDAPSFSNPVGVYFYDGAHTFDDQYRAFKAVEPLLADNAVIIIDDTDWPGVASANRLYTKRRREFTRVFRYKSPYNGEPRWWHGIELYTYRRDLARSPSRQRATLVVARFEVAARNFVVRLRYRARQLLSKGLHRVRALMR